MHNYVQIRSCLHRTRRYINTNTHTRSDIEKSRYYLLFTASPYGSRGDNGRGDGPSQLSSKRWEQFYQLYVSTIIIIHAMISTRFVAGQAKTIGCSLVTLHFAAFGRFAVVGASAKSNDIIECIATKTTTSRLTTTIASRWQLCPIAPNGRFLWAFL